MTSLSVVEKSKVDTGQGVTVSVKLVEAAQLTPGLYSIGISASMLMTYVPTSEASVLWNLKLLAAKGSSCWMMLGLVIGLPSFT